MLECNYAPAYMHRPRYDFAIRGAMCSGNTSSLAKLWRGILGVLMAVVKCPSFHNLRPERRNAIRMLAS